MVRCSGPHSFSAAASVFCREVFYAGGAATPPLAAMLRGGGRGGQLRVKLYVSLLWLCAAAPYEANLPARAWAALLGLADHETRGVRRIHEAIRDLHDRKLITVRDRGGMPSVLGLLDENAGQPSLHPALDRLQHASAPRCRAGATAPPPVLPDPIEFLDRGLR